MLTLRRFKALVDSYGADLQRWPPQVRGDAQALLGASLEARELLAEARRLDAAIEANARDDAALWQRREEAALARLRSGVAARIASPARPSTAWRAATIWRAEDVLAAIGRALVLNPGRFGIAAGCAIAVVAGLLIGGLYASTPAADSLLSMLDPAPIHLLAD
jgi:hypothetical protein